MLLLSTTLHSQARVVFTGNPYVVLNNGTNLVLDNPNTNAMNGAQGRIISEAEDNIVKWNIGSNTGAYQLPFRTDNATPSNTADDESVLIRYEPTGGGDAAGSVKFSTYRTAANNTPWASDITHFTQFNNPGLDNSAFVADRFYIIDADDYVTKPSITLAMFFADSEIGAPNTITEANLKAQRFNSTSSVWQDLMPIGNISVAQRVGVFAVAPADFFKSWVLVDNSSPLPIELIDFSATCEDGRVNVKWSTASETNNAFYSVMRSKDAQVWEKVKDVVGAENSVNTLAYEIWDSEPYAGVSYYKLVQTDMDGTETELRSTTSSCGDYVFEIISVQSDYNTFGGAINLLVSAGTDEVFDLELRDMSGKLLHQVARVNLVEGINTLQLNKNDLSMGAYLIQLRSTKRVLSSKVLLN